MPTVKIGMPRFFAASAFLSASPRRSPPSEIRMIALWSSAAGSSAPSAARMALPRSVSPRGADSGLMRSRALLRYPWSVVSGHTTTPVRRNATSAHLSPARESIRSATSALARSRRLGLTSSASIERDTSIAMTTLRARVTVFSIDLPHCGRAAAKSARKRPVTMHAV